MSKSGLGAVWASWKKSGEAEVRDKNHGKRSRTESNSINWCDHTGKYVVHKRDDIGRVQLNTMGSFGGSEVPNRDGVRNVLFLG